MGTVLPAISDRSQKRSTILKLRARMVGVLQKTPKFQPFRQRTETAEAANSNWTLGSRYQARLDWQQWCALIARCSRYPLFVLRTFFLSWPRKKLIPQTVHAPGLRLVPATTGQQASLPC